MVDEAAVVEGYSVFGIEPDRLFEVREGGVEVALAVIGEAAVVEGPGKFLTAPPARLDCHRAATDLLIE